MSKQKNDILIYGLILLVITAVSALLLAGANVLTKDKIAHNAQQAEQVALLKVMKEASSFESFDAAAAEGYGALAIYSAADANGQNIGYCIKLSQNGYGGAVEAIVGINSENTVTGIEIVSHSETPGLGARVTEDAFKGQFVGKKNIAQVVKAGAKEDEINAVSGATISSRAVTESVQKAIDIAKNIKGEGVDVNEGE